MQGVKNERLIVLDVQKLVSQLPFRRAKQTKASKLTAHRAFVTCCYGFANHLLVIKYDIIPV